MHGVISTPSSPEIVCMEQCEGSWGREKGESIQNVERAEHRVTPQGDLCSSGTKSSLPSALHSGATERMTEVTLITTQQLLGWLLSLSAPSSHPLTHTPGWTASDHIYSLSRENYSQQLLTKLKPFQTESKYAGVLVLISNLLIYSQVNTAAVTTWIIYKVFFLLVVHLLRTQDLITQSCLVTKEQCLKY